MEVVIITGMSGSGKSGVVNVLEDIGFFCIDNMPPQLLTKFAEVCAQYENDIDRVAIVTDARGGDMFFSLPDNLIELKQQGIKLKILFIDADDEVLIKRYKETRRKHPLYDKAEGDIYSAVRMERDLLMPMKELADFNFDTSLTSLAQLKEQITNTFLDKISDFMLVSCMSFGFKYGIPNEADLVFDVRFLPNPFYIPELKYKTGLEEQVRDFVMKHEQAQVFRDKLYDMIDFLLPMYIKEGKSQLVVAFGCTGGKHRSVTFAENMCKHLKEQGQRVRLSHRDIEK